MTNVIALHSVDPQQAAIWRLAKEVASALDRLPFILIGGLMVQLLEAERGVTSGFATGDMDVVLDVRAPTGATERAASALVDAGFEPEPYDDDLTYRFVRGDDIVDLLAPDHLGVRTSIVTVPPASTLPALGSRMARSMCRSRHWSARLSSRRGSSRAQPGEQAGRSTSATWPGSWHSSRTRTPRVRG